MNKETKKALEGSIKKWEDIAAGRGLDAGPDNCPLCAIFFNERGCGDCPVRLKADFGGCVNTPYSDWFNHHDEDHELNTQDDGIRLFKGCTTCLEHAQAEVDFLKSLREDG